MDMKQDSNNGPIMQDVKIHNEEILDILTTWSDFVIARKEEISEKIKTQLPPGLE